MKYFILLFFLYIPAAYSQQFKLINTGNIDDIKIVHGNFDTKKVSVPIVNNIVPNVLISKLSDGNFCYVFDYGKHRSWNNGTISWQSIKPDLHERIFLKWEPNIVKPTVVKKPNTDKIFHVVNTVVDFVEKFPKVKLYKRRPSEIVD